MVRRPRPSVNRKSGRGDGAATWGAALAAGSARLAAAGVASPRREAEELLAAAVRRPRARVLAGLAEGLAPRAAAGYARLLTARARRQPLQYLLGRESFDGLDLRVGPGVLIPRSETELLVAEALRRIDRSATRCVADLCTGSGNVALALARALPAARVAATDLSPAALRYARANRRRLGVDNMRCYLGRDDRPLPGAWRGACDLVTANPPYIPTRDLAGLQAEVRREPRLALDGGPDGLDAVRAMAAAARRLLKPRGVFACEIGIGQSTSTRAILERTGFTEVQILEDWNGIPRIVSARSAI